jgi:hypothetical protein
MSIEELQKKKAALEVKKLERQIKLLEEEDKKEEEAAEEAKPVEEAKEEGEGVEAKSHPFYDLKEFKNKEYAAVAGKFAEAVAKAQKATRKGGDTDYVDVHIEKSITKKYGAEGAEIASVAKDLAPALPTLDLISKATRTPMLQLETTKKWFPKLTRKNLGRVLEAVELQNKEIEQHNRAVALTTKTVNTSADSGWIPTDLNSQLAMHVMKSKAAAQALMSFDMPSNPYRWPISESPNTAYYVTESGASDVTVANSDANTGDITFDARKQAVRTDFSEEMNEDSVFALLPALQQIMGDALGDAFDQGVLFGDESTDTSNINLFGASPTTTAGQADSYLVCDGLVHRALVDADGSDVDINSASSISAGIASIYSAMGDGAKDPSDLAIFVPPQVYFQMLTDANLITLDKFGAGATILTGQVASVFGSPVWCSAGIPVTDANGRVDGVTPANNTQGSILVVQRSKTMIGFKRRMKVVSDFQAITDKTELVASMRYDVQCLTINRAGINALGYGYNINP